MGFLHTETVKICVLCKARGGRSLNIRFWKLEDLADQVLAIKACFWIHSSPRIINEVLSTPLKLSSSQENVTNGLSPTACPHPSSKLKGMVK